MFLSQPGEPFLRTYYVPDDELELGEDKAIPAMKELTAW